VWNAVAASADLVDDWAWPALGIAGLVVAALATTATLAAVVAGLATSRRTPVGVLSR
jgi:hypothetical protein